MNPTPHRAAPAAWLAAACLAGAAFGGCGSADAPAPVPAPPRAVYVTVVRHDGGETTRSLTGVLRPRVEAVLSFQVGGKVLARHVGVGQSVRRGQVLARLDPADQDLAASVASQQLRAAEIEAAQSATDAARSNTLAAVGALAAADHERQQARLDTARAQVGQTRRQLDLARRRAAYTVMTAPFDGVVTAVDFEAGQVVAEGAGIASLARPDELEVVADIPESLAPQLGRCTARAVPWDGTGTAIALHLRELAPRADAASRTYAARFSAAAGAGPALRALRMGSTVALHLTRPGEPGSAELPAGALLMAGEQASVWVVPDGGDRLAKQTVAVVSHAADRVRVRGLPEGALVVSVGAQKLDAGLRVRPVRRPLDALDAGHAMPGSPAGPSL
jgi:RND family efflux transporter MFP subunit